MYHKQHKIMQGRKKKKEKKLSPLFKDCLAMESSGQCLSQTADTKSSRQDTGCGLLTTRAPSMPQVVLNRKTSTPVEALEGESTTSALIIKTSMALLILVLDTAPL